ncbi:MAG: hypothetical protein AAGD07_00945 [Planctomycetota bacterium]
MRKNQTGAVMLWLVLLTRFVAGQDTFRSSVTSPPHAGRLAIAEPAPAMAFPAIPGTRHRVQEDTALRAIAANRIADPTSRVLIAVGDAGAITRSPDGGQTWRTMESPTQFPLDDVVWLSDERVIVVGGAYEPITNLSRGIVLVSDNAGLSWQHAHGEELPRIRRVVLDFRSGQVLGLGDPCPVEGTSLFVSQDGGVTWGPTHESRWPKEDLNAAFAANPGSTRELMDTTGQRVRFETADHGKIQCVPSQGSSETGVCTVVRGNKNTASKVVICGEATQIPWAWLGRESLIDGQRITLILDHADSTPDAVRSLQQRDRLRQVAGRLGIGAVRIATDHATRVAILQDNPTATLVSGESLSETQRDRWRQAHREAKGQANAFALNVLFRVHRHPGNEERPIRPSIRTQTMLTPLALTTDDLMLDADLLLCPHAYAWQGTTFTLRGRPLTTAHASGFDSAPFGSRKPKKQLPQATRHRVQIANAAKQHRGRVLTMLSDQVMEPSLLSQVLSQMESIDRIRIIWTALRHLESDRHSAIAQKGTQEEALLAELAKTGFAPAARWARLKQHSNHHSIERQWVAPKDWFTDATSHSIPSPQAQSTQANALSVQAIRREQEKAQKTPILSTRGPTRSPFQVKTAAYESGPEDVMPSQATYPWGIQQTQGIDSLLIDGTRTKSPVPMRVSSALATQQWVRLPAAQPDADPVNAMPNRIWDLHPVVTAGYGVTPATLAAKQAWQEVRLRQHSPRPRLDGMADDPCWTNAATWTTPLHRVWLACDTDYYFIAVAAQKPNPQASPSAIRIRLDRDMDPLNAFCLDLFPSQGRSTTHVDNRHAWQPRWYASLTDPGATPEHELLAEIAIPRGELPNPPMQSPSMPMSLEPRAKASLGTQPRRTTSPPKHWLISVTPIPLNPRSLDADQGPRTISGMNPMPIATRWRRVEEIATP